LVRADFIRPNFCQQLNKSTIQQLNNQHFNNDKDLSPLRKNIRMRAFHRLLVRESAAQRKHQSLSEGTLQRLPVQGVSRKTE
jgi:hypothetical protein